MSSPQSPSTPSSPSSTSSKDSLSEKSRPVDPGSIERYRLAGHEVLQHSFDIIDNWRPISESWALRFGGGGLAVLAGIPGLIMTDRIRNAHRLQGIRVGRIAAALPASVTPFAITLGLQSVFRERILLSQTSCSACQEISAVTSQMFTGIIMPSVIAVITNHMSLRALSYRVPSVISKEFIEWSRNMVKKSKQMLIISAAIQALAASSITYFQFSQWEKMNEKLLKAATPEAMKEAKKSSTVITRIGPF